MRLETENAPAIEEPADAAIEKALASLERRGTSWVALSADAGRSALVTAARGRRGYVLEVVGRRVRRCRRELPPETVARIFRAYRRGDDTWSRDLAWKDVTNEGWWFYLVVILTLAVAVALAFRRLAEYLASLRAE
jgi:hypothetical protein